MMDVEQKWPKVRGMLSQVELRYLAVSLGFRSNVFLEPCGIRPDLSAETFIRLLDSRVYDRKLHRTFNTRDANYNVKSTKKSLELLQHKTLSFSEIRQARLAFQLYENDDQMGMHASASTALQALQMCSKVASTLKLSDVLKGMKGSLDIPMRLQLYEFLHLLVFHSDPLEQVEQAWAVAREQRTSAGMLVSASDALLTRAEKAQRYLDTCYRELLFPTIEVPTVKIESERLINTQAWQAVIQHGRSEAHKILPPLLQSAAKLSRSSSGSPLRLCQSVSIGSPLNAGDRTRTRAGTAPLQQRLVKGNTNQKPGVGLHSFSWRSFPDNLSRTAAVGDPAEENQTHDNNAGKVPFLGKHDAARDGRLHASQLSVAQGGSSLAPNDDTASRSGDSAVRRRSPASNSSHTVTSSLGVSDVEYSEHQHKMDDLRWLMLQQGLQRGCLN